MLKDILASYGPIEVLQVTCGLQKIEFDDLLKLEALIIKKPNIAQDILYNMIHLRTEYFYKYLIEIMVQEGILPKSKLIKDASHELQS